MSLLIQQRLDGDFEVFVDGVQCGMYGSLKAAKAKRKEAGLKS